MILKEKNQNYIMDKDLINSFEIDYIFDNNPIKRFKNKPTIKNIKSSLDNLKLKIVNSTTIFKKNPIAIITSFIQIIIALISSLIFLFKSRPKIVFGMGGYSSFPVCIAAKLLKIPFILYENNLIIGKANKFLLPLAEKIFVSYSELEGIKKEHEYRRSCKGHSNGK